MTSNELLGLIDEMTSGEISGSNQDRLQARLKSDSDARRIYRERIDLETALRVWASETPLTMEAPSRDLSIPSHVAWMAVAAVILIVTLPLVWTWLNVPDDKNRAENDGVNSSLALGTIQQQPDARWSSASDVDSGDIKNGRLTLETGVAELIFNSGTNLVMEAPCELLVLSAASARLLAGNVVVDVTEVSNGFVLETPEAQITDEGTEYGVSLDETMTEVHVFDGSVIWTPIDSEESAEELIEAGNAVAYQRSSPYVSKHIPFGKRQFVRNLDAAVQKQGGESLLSYDGFENLAGRLRRGRSGFGWESGWESARRGRGSLADVIETPADTPFGISRSDRRQLHLNAGDDIRRRFENAISAGSQEVFVSFLAQKAPANSGSGSLRISMEGDLSGRTRRARQQQVSFGVTNDGFPFVNTGHQANQTATLVDESIHFCVFKFSTKESKSVVALRIYRLSETVDLTEPDTWAISAAEPVDYSEFRSIRLTSNGDWLIDELKVGTSWKAVTSAQ